MPGPSLEDREQGAESWYGSRLARELLVRSSLLRSNNIKEIVA